MKLPNPMGNCRTCNRTVRLIRGKTPGHLPRRPSERIPGKALCIGSYQLGTEKE